MDDNETSSRPPSVVARRAFPTEAVALGAGVLVLVMAGIVTLFSLAGGDDADQGSIATIADGPRATFDASISNAADTTPPSLGRDISITDEPIVIGPDGNIVGPADATNGTGATDERADDGANLLGGDDPEDKRMPDLICRGLQAAQDEIQDHGVFGSKSKDATGQGRRQIWDRNWIVVAQDPEPGEKIGEFEATLYVVKQGDDENTCD